MSFLSVPLKFPSLISAFIHYKTFAELCIDAYNWRQMNELLTAARLTGMVETAHT
jgi:hypothetical protein